MTLASIALETESSLGALRAEFTDAHGYLAACTAGLPMSSTRTAVMGDLLGRPDPVHYGHVAERTRSSFAQLMGTPRETVAIGSQTSVFVAMIAASLPDGSEVLCPDDEFSSLVLPFVHAGRGIRVRTAPLAELAAAVSHDTSLVAFSLVQSACGSIADTDAIVRAARRVGARTLCDVTQAAGWMPVDATIFDAVVCHAYKWLCAPRGVAFLVARPSFLPHLRPMNAGWYAGEDPWASCYGTDAALAGDARRFDVSPAWQAFVGAEPALRRFADADMHAVRDYTTALAREFRVRIGIEGPDSAIVSWHDPDAAALSRLTAAGVTGSGRNGRVRVAFHIFNDRSDVDRAARALGC
jgi:selenocysteine lyase/cysteine desulfurase